MNTLNDEILTALDHALTHPRPDNRHLALLLHLCRRRENAAKAKWFAIKSAAQYVKSLESHGHLSDYASAGAVERCAYMLGLPEVDVIELGVALEEAIAASKEASVFEAETVSIRCGDPAASVYAAYGLARDLIDVEFDCEPDCPWNGGDED